MMVNSNIEDDIEIAPGQPAYQFDGVEKLARLSRNDPLKMVRNAGMFEMKIFLNCVYLTVGCWLILMLIRHTSLSCRR